MCEVTEWLELVRIYGGPNMYSYFNGSMSNFRDQREIEGKTLQEIKNEINKTFQ